MKIAFLGLGAMGSRMANRMLDAGHDLTVWNRTESAAYPLMQKGARIAVTPAAAVCEADLVFSMVRDDIASKYVWSDSGTGALKTIREGAIAIDCSTLSFEWVKQLSILMHKKNISFIEAPVSGSRPAAENGQLVFFAAGDKTLIERVKPTLLLLGNQINLVGDIGCGAVTKLFTNALLGTQVALFAELLGACREHSLSATSILKAISTTSVWAPVANYLSMSMLAEEYSPQFPVELLNKDLGYTTALSKHHMPVVNTVLGIFQRAAQRGYAEENMTAVAKLYQTSESFPRKAYSATS
ncbi:NAD(P)-dependent oxidoreductase [Rheinheimera texasensis]|uniref:NAD(P)-dependent oxidoreductase n=1 Tax=Rheinheimera texasensis TaxID=306205 RepID=UPI00146F9C67|nr:NAD(P)-dependent oxidoreductase [Rheinheimera texasensis]